MAHAIVDGVPLHWREAGQGPALVLLHPGPGLDGAVLWPWFEPLADRCHVLALDLACSGKSEGGDPTTWTIERQADLVAGWIDALVLERPVVLGHSYGSFVALTLAVRHPDVAAGIVASCGAASEYAFDALEARIIAFGDDIVSLAFDAEDGVETPDDCLGAWRGQLPFLVADRDSAGAEALSDALGEVVFQTATVRNGADETYDLRGSLHRIDVPVLAIGGAQDRCLLPIETQEIARLVPDGEAVVIGAAGHFAYAEQAETYRAALTGWLERVWD